MKLRQLQYVREVVRCGLNISKAADALHTSQPGISQQIRALEEELRIDIFVRDKNRLVSLTPNGELLVGYVSTVLTGIRNIEDLAKSSDKEANEELTIVATHTQARYILPSILKEFWKAYPAVNLSVRHCGIDEIFDVFAEGHADIAVMPLATAESRDVLTVRCREFNRIVLVPDGHPLLDAGAIDLEKIARYPLIMYEQSIPTRRQYLDIFAAAGIKPVLALNAINADVMKACVESDLGIAILPEFVFSPERDTRLRAIDVSNLFPQAYSYVALHRRRPLRKNMINFLHLLAPHISRHQFERELRSPAEALA